jgi:hypothetical protein
MGRPPRWDAPLLARPLERHCQYHSPAEGGAGAFMIRPRTRRGCWQAQAVRCDWRLLTQAQTEVRGGARLSWELCVVAAAIAGARAAAAAALVEPAQWAVTGDLLQLAMARRSRGTASSCSVHGGHRVFVKHQPARGLETPIPAGVWRGPRRRRPCAAPRDGVASAVPARAARRIRAARDQSTINLQYHGVAARCFCTDWAPATSGRARCRARRTAGKMTGEPHL